MSFENVSHQSHRGPKRSEPFSSPRFDKSEQERQSDPSPGAQITESQISRKKSPSREAEKAVNELRLAFPELAALKTEDFVFPEDLVIAADDFEDQESFLLGSGSQGTILKSTVLPLEDEYVAVKVGKNVQILEEYIKIRRFSHSNIIEAKHFSVATEEAPEGGEEVFIFMAVYEYCGVGDLQSYMAKHPEKCRDTKFIRKLFKGVLDALQYLHARNIVHCDVKPENILLNSNLEPKLADFGMAQELSDTMIPQGTPSFLAPEVARAWASGITSTSFSPSIDIFSLGVSAVLLLTGRYPYRRISAKLERHRRGTYSYEEMDSWYTLTFHWRAFQNLFPEQSDTVFRCLTKDPLRRPSASELLDSFSAK